MFFTGLPDLGTAYIGLLFTGLSGSLMAMMTALEISITVCIIFCVMLCSATISAMVFLRMSCMILPICYVFSLPCMRLLDFYFLHHIMLLALKDDNTTGSF